MLRCCSGSFLGTPYPASRWWCLQFLALWIHFRGALKCTQLFSRSWIWILLQSLQRETRNPSQVVWNLPSVRAIVKLKADWIAPPKTIEERPPVQKYSLATRWLKRSSLSSSLLFIFAGFGPRLPPREHKRKSRKAVSSWRAPLILQRSA